MARRAFFKDLAVGDGLIDFSGDACIVQKMDRKNHMVCVRYSQKYGEVEYTRGEIDHCHFFVKDDPIDVLIEAVDGP